MGGELGLLGVPRNQFTQQPFPATFSYASSTREAGKLRLKFPAPREQDVAIGNDEL